MASFENRSYNVSPRILPREKSSSRDSATRFGCKTDPTWAGGGGGCAVSRKWEVFFIIGILNIQRDNKIKKQGPGTKA